MSFPWALKQEAPWPDPMPGSERVGGMHRATAAATHRGGHVQTLGEASVGKQSAYFCPKIDFI
jgi:hypothetical protein